MFLSGPDLDGNGEERPPKPRKKQFNALGVMEEIDADGESGTDATLDIAPAEAPKRGAAVRPEPTVHLGSKSGPLSKALSGGIAGVPGVPGTPGGSADWSNVGRNDPCPCGSGKKFKKCHGANL